MPFGDNGELRNADESLVNDAIVGHVVGMISIEQGLADRDIPDLQLLGVVESDQQGQHKARSRHVAGIAATDLNQGTVDAGVDFVGQASARLGIAPGRREKRQQDRVEGDHADGDREDPKARKDSELLHQRNARHRQTQDRQPVRRD